MTSKFDARTYKYFGLSMTPFLVYEINLYTSGALSHIGAATDITGNLFFTWCAYQGYCFLKDDQQTCKLCSKCDCICGKVTAVPLDVSEKSDMLLGKSNS
jgi:hypothetical protein